MTNKINPSGVYVVPQPKSSILIPSIPTNSSNNSDENADGELLTRGEPLPTIINILKYHNIAPSRNNNTINAG